MPKRTTNFNWSVNIENGKIVERRNTVKWADWYLDSIAIDMEDGRYGQALIRAEELKKMILDLKEDNFKGYRDE